ncbi:hypothetical protein JZ751_010672 [Albula glossodonta]|uniref:Uncharacterized protein n=1 Tax=Albula glossodonta TaxID=121402 RepID=A0A8T2N7K6_9TELE|nr:hypothetical protein JZ751_010672 [Albula glossodonta]
MQTASYSELSPYLQWQTLRESVFEMREEARYEGEHYRGRVGVEVQRFKNGDCSLLLKEVQFSDAGLYKSFIAVGSRRRRSFIDSVQLNVRVPANTSIVLCSLILPLDHKYKEVLKEGQNLELKLHTHLASTVIFQKAGAPESRMIWERDSGAWGSGDWGGRLTQGDEKRERLILSGVRMEDAGTYKVLDPHGLAVSTVHLTVEEVGLVLLDLHHEVVQVDELRAHGQTAEGGLRQDLVEAMVVLDQLRQRPLVDRTGYVAER